MKTKKIITGICGALAAAAGVLLTILTRQAALAEGATAAQTVPFALSLILAVVGVVALLLAFLPPRKKVEVRTLTLAALFTALCYIGFTYCKIDIPVGAEKTAFHLGNVFCVLAALLLDGFWGGMAGAIGMTLADLTTAYVTSAPKTFILKLCIGLIVGMLAHKVFKLNREGERKIPLPVATVLSCIGGMAFNMVADPVLGYFYKMYVLGVPQQAANIWAKMGAVTTAVNAVIAVIAATVFYLALRPALKRMKMLPQQ